jgi:hypothetical protein
LDLNKSKELGLKQANKELKKHCNWSKIYKKQTRWIGLKLQKIFANWFLNIKYYWAYKGVFSQWLSK